MANIYNKYNFNNNKDTLLNLNSMPININSLNNFSLICYRGVIAPRVPLDLNNSKKIDQLIYAPIEDISFNNNKNNEKNIEIVIKNSENEKQININKDIMKISSIKGPNSKLFLEKQKDKCFEKNVDALFNMEALKEASNTKNIIEPIPPQNIISIINGDKNRDKNNIISYNKEYESVNNIILNNINLLPKYNNYLNKIPIIINYNNNPLIYNFNFNIYTNNFLKKDSNNFQISSNSNKKINIPKPIFAVCSDSKYELNELDKKRRRGRKSLSINKNYKIHSAYDDDNLLRKVQVHFLSFVINYVNDIIKTFVKIKNPPLFKNLDYKIKKTVNHKFVEELKSKNIAEILQLKVSPKMKIHDETVNKNIYYNVCKICPFMADFLNRSYSSLFTEYYNNNNKIFIVNGKIVQLSIKTKTFADLMIKNYKHKEKLKSVAKRFFLNNYKTLTR